MRILLPICKPRTIDGLAADVTRRSFHIGEAMAGYASLIALRTGAKLRPVEED